MGEKNGTIATVEHARDDYLILVVYIRSTAMP